MANTPSTPAIEGLPSNKEVVSNLKDLEQRINILLPHINKAQTAFGGLENVQKSITDLQNRISQAKAVYGS